MRPSLPIDKTSFIGAILLLAGGPIAAQAQTRQLPEGPGKATVQRICSGCHAAEIVIGRHETKERWGQIVSDMVEKGANGTDDEFNQIIDYLTANFSKKADENASSDKSLARVSSLLRRAPFVRTLPRTALGYIGTDRRL